MTYLLDTREPGGDGTPHPWAPYLPDGARLVRGTLESGDLALAALPDGATVDRKTVSDFLAAIGRERERVDREVRRARHQSSFCFIVEGTLGDVLNANHARGQLTEAAILGTIAAWTRRGAPTIFAGTVAAAADLAFRIVGGQVREIERASKALARADGAVSPRNQPSKPAGPSRAAGTPSPTVRPVASLSRQP